MNSQRVLIVDDEPINVSILEEILEDEFTLSTASSGEEALELATELPPDVVLLDIMMPGISGYETCRRLRANPALSQTKVILVSAKALVAERLEGYDAGADDYVTKPFDSEELLAKVRVFARLKSLEEVDTLRSQLLGLFSHETRTPLSGIIGPVELLLEPDVDDEGERRMFLEMIRDNANRLRDYFDKALLLFELKSSRFPLSIGACPLRDVFATVVEQVAWMTEDKSVPVSWPTDTDVVVRADPEYLKLAFHAVLENAARYSPSGETVEICVEEVGDCAHVSIIDRGPGLDEKVAQEVLEGMVSGDLLHHKEGTGLSLAISSQILFHHDGDLRLETGDEIGTRLTFVVPLATEGESGTRETELPVTTEMGTSSAPPR